MKKIVLLAVVAFAVAAAVLLYRANYRFSFISGAYKTGELSLRVPAADFEIFIDGKKRPSESSEGWLAFKSLKPGRHSVLIAKQDYWPWLKNIRIKENAVLEANALLVPQNPEWKILVSPLQDQSDKTLEEVARSGKIIKDAAEAQNVFKKDAGDIRLSLNEERTVLAAEWLGAPGNAPYYFCDDSSCSDSVAVLNSKSPIKSFDFYPGRTDAAIIAIEDGVYAIEVDGRGGRMLFPFYKGKSPVSVVYGGGDFLYVFDENILAETKLNRNN